MTIDATGSSSLQKLSGAYQARDTEEKEDYLGREDFLTMLVAQLQNQDPLNPMEGSDFSAQLAQFSSLEQLLNLNESMKSMVTAFENSSEVDVTGFVGKEVTGEVNSIEVESGTPSKGYYELSKTSEVMVTIYNSEGNIVKTLYPGQLGPGQYDVDWDGTNYQGDSVEDGSYSYEVVADSGNGFATLSTTISGVVEGIAYQGGKAYLMVDGFPVNPSSLVSVSEPSSDTGDSASMSMMDYLGKNISYSDHIMAVDGEKISGDGIRFNLNAQEDVAIQILDSNGNEINRFEILAEDTVEGENVFQWDGMDNASSKVSDGIYSCSVTSASGSVETTNSGEVTGIKSFKGAQYLVVGDHDDIVTLSSVTEVK
ncbi:Flagellar hook capping protein [Desulfamplus magnetovallimortis]|uniref:Basal-body rod modification protein FlgD n=1 Tax=Desulfamplus magnetovallimortis TaxID=1246637 RepID=A0A1W1H9X8_9BACT|nr:FlgD immunoglobulin-like domain containing protein [Desulfamplus magnetovallimortis]SLM29253.1 Flagellar hook capping protein [Desulfamplus magnetovallimortis]